MRRFQSGARYRMTLRHDFSKHFSTETLLHRRVYVAEPVARCLTTVSLLHRRAPWGFLSAAVAPAPCCIAVGRAAPRYCRIAALWRRKKLERDRACGGDTRQHRNDGKGSPPLPGSCSAASQGCLYGRGGPEGERGGFVKF